MNKKLKLKNKETMILKEKVFFKKILKVKKKKNKIIKKLDSLILKRSKMLLKIHNYSSSPNTRKNISFLLEQGFKGVEIAKIINVDRSTVSRHIKSLNNPTIKTTQNDLDIDEKSKELDDLIKEYKKQIEL